MLVVSKKTNLSISLVIDPELIAQEQEFRTIAFSVLNTSLERVGPAKHRELLEAAFMLLLNDPQHDPYQESSRVMSMVPDHLRHGVLAALAIDCLDLGSLALVSSLMNALIDASRWVGQLS